MDDKEESEQNGNACETSVPFYKLFVFADKIDVGVMMMGALGSVMGGIPLPVITYLLGDVVDALGDRALTRELVHKVSKVAGQCIIVAAVAAFGFFCEGACWKSTAERQAARIREIYLSSLLYQDIAFFDTEISTGEISESISADIFTIREVIGGKVGKLIQLNAMFICGFIVAFLRGWRLTVVVLSTVPLIIASGAIGSFLTSRVSKQLRAANAEAGNIVGEAISAIKTVVSFTGEKKALDACEMSLKKSYRISLWLGLASGFGEGLLMFSTLSTYAFALWYGAYLIIHNGYSGGKVATVMFAVLEGGGALGQAFPCFSAFAAGNVAACKVFKVIKSVPEIVICKEKGLTLEDMKGNIELQNVTFSYPSRQNVTILENFSLLIPAGKTTALVGESGSGKSTVVSLIERFYDPQVGKVLIDGVDMKNIQLQWLRKQIGLVSQEPVLFGASIKDNIGFGKHMATFEEIQTAAKLANAASFIENLPEGYETMVGDRGAQLSGGQKQRIAIARAILKNPCVLLLDEATSALDAESERIVQEALEQVMVDRTTVIIAHRLTTVKNANFICVLNKGTLTEQGTHTELIQKKNGAYFQLVKRQESQKDKRRLSKPVVGESMDRCSSAFIQDSSSKTGNGNTIVRISKQSPFRSSPFRSSHSVERLEDLKECRKCKGLLDLLKNLKAKKDPEKSSKLGQNSIFRLAPLNKPEIPVLLLGFLAAVVNGTTFPIFGLFLANMIDTFFEPSSQLKKDSIFWAGMFMVLAFAALIVNPAEICCFTISGNKLVNCLRLMTFRQVLRQEMAWFDDQESSSGVITARLSTGAVTVKGLVGDVLALTIQNLATIAAGLFITFWACWQLAFMLVGLLTILLVQAWAQLNLIKKFSAKAKIASAQPVHVAIDALSNIRTIASFCAEDQVLKLHREKCEDPFKAAMQLGMMDGIGLAVLNFVLFGTYGFSFWVGARLTTMGKTNPKDIFRVFFAIALSAIAISESMRIIPDVSRVKSAVSSLFLIIDRKSKIDPEDFSGKTLDEMKGEIAFRHVHFKYPTRPQAHILQDLCLSLEPGKSIALVGESGSGKSTILSLLERFYDPDAGEILIDKINIKTFQVKWLRQQIGLVGQEPFLFDATIRENIAYGSKENVSEDQIVSAAEISNAHQFISGLPDGYNTRVGERGIQLSGGQKQRVSIARTVLKNPCILLLDEATSALDVESEHIVQEALNRVMVGRTTIVVAHRLCTVRGADSIAVMRGGRIIEQGTHRKLICKTNSVYSALVKSAASLS